MTVSKDDDVCPLHIRAPAGVPSRTERFADAASAYGEAMTKGDGVALAAARRRLAEVSWALAPQIVDALRIAESVERGMI